MIGAKPLADTEISLILSHLGSLQHKCLFILGYRTGFRISEILCLKVSDCIQYGNIRDSITVARRNTKGKHSSRTVVLHREAKKALKDYIEASQLAPSALLFPFTRMTAHRLLKRAVEASKIEGRVSTHSMRKTFAKAMYERLDRDLVNTQKALGHKSISSTISYLSFDEDLIIAAILA